MPTSSGYRFLLRIPGAPGFFVAAAVGRVGIAMTGLGLVWLIQARTGSYATAGTATAGFAVAEAVNGPQLARLVDRFGQSRVLPYSLLAHALAIGVVLVARSPVIAVGAATCAGAAVPQLGALSGARWAHLLRGRSASTLASAFALESLANATAFLLGPVLVTTLGAVGHTAAATVTAAALIVVGGSALVVQRRTEPPPARARSDDHGRRTSLLSRAFLLIAGLNLAIGLYFGTMSISVSAFAVGRGTPGVAAPIIAVSSISGLISGWLYGMRRHTMPAPRQLALVTLWLTVGGLALPWAPSPVWLGAAVIVTGAAVPPILVLMNVLTERSVDPSVLTQAFTWNNSASAAGSALAASLAGRVADAFGASAALALAPSAGFLLFLLALTFVLTHRNWRAPAEQ